MFILRESWQSERALLKRARCASIPLLYTRNIIHPGRAFDPVWPDFDEALSLSLFSPFRCWAHVRYILPGFSFFPVTCTEIPRETRALMFCFHRRVAYGFSTTHTLQQSPLRSGCEWVCAYTNRSAAKPLFFARENPQSSSCRVEFCDERALLTIISSLHGCKISPAFLIKWGGSHPRNVFDTRAMAAAATSQLPATSKDNQICSMMCSHATFGGCGARIFIPV